MNFLDSRSPQMGVDQKNKFEIRNEEGVTMRKIF